MAILGFLAHTLPEAGASVEAAVKTMTGLTTYGVHQGCYVVAVAEAEAGALEDILEEVRSLEGVLTCYVTSMSTEDEIG